MREGIYYNPRPKAGGCGIFLFRIRATYGVAVSVLPSVCPSVIRHASPPEPLAASTNHGYQKKRIAVLTVFSEKYFGKIIFSAENFARF